MPLFQHCVVQMVAFIEQSLFHCSMGENLWNDLEPLNLPNLWRENTIKSFLKSRQHGATFVEFDVQVC